MNDRIDLNYTFGRGSETSESSLIGVHEVKLLLFLTCYQPVGISFPWVTRFSSRSARWPPHDGVRRARRPNLCHDLRGLRPLARDSQRDRLAHRPHGNDTFRGCGLFHDSRFVCLLGCNDGDRLYGWIGQLFAAKAEIGLVDPHAV